MHLLGFLRINFFMNVSSGIQAKGSTVPQPRHQAIGRNGSFWIPEDSSELSKHPKPVAQKRQ
jgi:hypothetical protein